MIDVSGALGTAITGFNTELTAVAAVALPVVIALWGAPKAVGFFKRLAK